MSKPEVSNGVVYEIEEPRPRAVVEAERGLRRFSGLLNHMPGVHLDITPEQSPYQLGRKINDDAVTISHALRKRAGEDVLKTGAMIETAGYPYELTARAQVLDDESRKVTRAQLDITSEAGNETRLQIRTTEIPTEYNHEELVEPKADVWVVEGQDAYGFDDYAPLEQQDLADVVHRAAAAIDQAKVLRLHNGGKSELLH